MCVVKTFLYVQPVCSTCHVRPATLNIIKVIHSIAIDLLLKKEIFVCIIINIMNKIFKEGKICTNTWDGISKATLCDVGYVRTGCLATCSGSFDASSPDIFPIISKKTETEGREGYNLGDNDTCSTSNGKKNDAQIRVTAICVKFQ